MKVEVRMGTLMEFLDEHEGGELYPKLSEDDEVIRVDINPITAEFIIGKRHSPYRRRRK